MSDELKVIPFKGDEDGYEQWLSKNPGGYVFNYVGGSDPSMNVVHVASCEKLHSVHHAGRRTVEKKLCSTNYFDLLEEVSRLQGQGGWTQCSFCQGRRA